MSCCFTLELERLKQRRPCVRFTLRVWADPVCVCVCLRVPSLTVPVSCRCLPPRPARGHPSTIFTRVSLALGCDVNAFYKLVAVSRVSVCLPARLHIPSVDNSVCWLLILTPALPRLRPPPNPLRCRRTTGDAMYAFRGSPGRTAHRHLPAPVSSVLQSPKDTPLEFFQDASRPLSARMSDKPGGWPGGRCLERIKKKLSRKEASLFGRKRRLSDLPLEKWKGATSPHLTKPGCECFVS